MYEYQAIEGSDYPLFYFRTCNDYEYHVSFSEMPNDLLKEITVYSICVDCINSRSPEIDSEVGKTICCIIQKFIANHTESLIAYVCESRDNKQHARQRKFEGWYNRYNTGSCVFRKYDIYVEEYDLNYFSSVIFDANTYSPQFIDATYGEALRKMTSKD